MIDVVVRLHPEAARAWHDGADVPSLMQLRRLLSRFQVVLQPQHPGTADPQLQSYFIIPVETADQAGRLATALLELDAIDAAYAQPPPSPA